MHLQAISKYFGDHRKSAKVTKEQRPTGRNARDIPYDALEDVGHSERGLCKYHEQNHVSPGKLAKLVLIQAPFQCQDEPHKPCTRCKSICHLNEERGECHPEIIIVTDQ